MSQAKDDLLWIAKRFRGVLELVPQLEAIESLEDRIAELKAETEKAKAQHEEANADHARAILEHQEVLANMLADKAQAYAELKDLKATARDKIKADLAKAEATYDKMSKAAEARVAEIEVEINAKLEQLKSVENTLYAAEERLKAVEAKINELKGL